MKKKLRTIQPAHESDKFTVEQAMAAWRKVEGKSSDAAVRRPRSRKAPASSISTPASPTRAKVAADRDQKPSDR
jgi:hypothetical protein